jgi:hypothetical protein
MANRRSAQIGNLLGLTSFSLIDTVWIASSPLGVSTGELHLTLFPQGNPRTFRIHYSVLLSYKCDAEVRVLFETTNGSRQGTGSLHARRAFHTATLLPSGQVLVAGGFGRRHYLDSAELYDQATGTWTVGHLNIGRSKHTATLLPSGQVLVAGGFGPGTVGNGGALSSAELFEDL